MYRAKFEELWETLRESKIVHKTLLDIKNSDIFKYSPYKALTAEQDLFVTGLISDLKNKKTNTYVVSGSAGTGKTVLSTYLIKRLAESEETKNMKVGLVIAMTSLRATLRKVFRSVNGLKTSMVIGPNDVYKEKYDLLIVDEAHRLKKRMNLGASYSAFDNVNKKLGLGKESTQLDWILNSSDRQIFFYDANQSVMPADIDNSDFIKLNSKRYTLANQLRVQAGDSYIAFIDSIFESKIDNICNFENYEFKIFNDVSEMHDVIRQKEKKFGLSRMVAGYSWPWITKKNKDTKYDIEIGGYKAKWNSVNADWVNSKNAIDEVGCIHTIQGYDLNYVGVIIGKELRYDIEKEEICIDKEKYYDRSGYMGIRDKKELERYIINIYKTLLTRGIKGTYIYVVDKNLRDFLQTKISTPQTKNAKTETRKFIPITDVFDKELSEKGIPVLAEVNAGEPLNIAEENLIGYIVDGENKKIKKDDLFAVRVDGHSMNKKRDKRKKDNKG